MNEEEIDTSNVERVVGIVFGAVMMIVAMLALFFLLAGQYQLTVFTPVYGK